MNFIYLIELREARIVKIGSFIQRDFPRNWENVLTSREHTESRKRTFEKSEGRRLADGVGSPRRGISSKDSLGLGSRLTGKSTGAVRLRRHWLKFVFRQRIKIVTPLPSRRARYSITHVACQLSNKGQTKRHERLKHRREMKRGGCRCDETRHPEKVNEFISGVFANSSAPARWGRISSIFETWRFFTGVRPPRRET